MKVKGYEVGPRADLRRANLREAYLGGAYLGGANLGGADLRRAYLGGANLGSANLGDANLGGAYLGRAYLGSANLGSANLGDAKLPHFQIPQSGTLTVFKATRAGVVTLEIPSDARRTASLVGRKCRAEYALVLDAPDGAVSKHDGKTAYIVGEIVQPDKYCDDIRIECSHGIHFFLTREEAEEWC